MGREEAYPIATLPPLGCLQRSTSMDRNPRRLGRVGAFTSTVLSLPDGFCIKLGGGMSHPFAASLQVKGKVT